MILPKNINRKLILLKSKIIRKNKKRNRDRDILKDYHLGGISRVKALKKVVLLLLMGMFSPSL